MSEVNKKTSLDHDSVGCSEEILDEVILWQDHSHPCGYRPILKLLTFPGHKKSIEMNVFGTVFRVDYVSPECIHD